MSIEHQLLRLGHPSDLILFWTQSFREQAQTFLTATNVGRVVSVAGLALLLATLGIAVQRVHERANTARAKRLRQVGEVAGCALARHVGLGRSMLPRMH